ncbi:MAG: hypothetical protein SF028_03470 [Candidatus Sumerlaeia bacterium]|nr:hypothetical protein [Candidatus Sumerlaeia bacterium]
MPSASNPTPPARPDFRRLAWLLDRAQPFRPLPAAHTAALAFAVLCAAWLAAPLWAALLADPPAEDLVIAASSRDVAAEPRARFNGAWVEDPDGLVPGPEATLEFAVPAGEAQRLVLRLQGDPRTEWTARLSGGGASVTVFGVRAGADAEIAGPGVPEILLGARDATLVVGPRDAATAGALGSARLRLTLSPASDAPGAAGLAALALLPLVLSVALMAARGWESARAILFAFGVAGALALAARALPMVRELAPALALILAGLSASALVRKLVAGDEAPRARLLLEAAVLAVVLVVGAESRFAAWADARWFPLRPDAVQYLQQAVQGTQAVEGAPDVREPLLAASLKAAWLVLPNSIASARLATALLSVAAIAAAWGLGRSLHSPLAGLAAAAVVALSPVWIEGAPSVLATDLLAVLVAAVLWLSSRPPMAGPAQAAAVGGACGLLLLAQLGALPLVAAAIAWNARRARWSLAAIALASGLAIAGAAPTILANLDAGGPFHNLEMHTRYYANRHLGAPDGDAGPYAGGPMSTAAWLSRWSPADFVARPVLGAWNAFAIVLARQALFPAGAWLLLPFLGVPWLLWRRRDLIAPLALLAAWAIPLCLVAREGIDWRLAAPAAPLLAALWAAAIVEAARALMERRAASTPRSPRPAHAPA